MIDDQSGIESVGWWLLTQQPLDEVSQVPISWHIFCGVAGNVIRKKDKESVFLWLQYFKNFKYKKSISDMKGKCEKCLCKYAAGDTQSELFIFCAILCP